MRHDCVVVGAGPAGLAASAALRARGVDHVVLERGRPGETWRSQRWAAMRLNTPGWMNGMLGPQDEDDYLSGAEVADRLVGLGAAAPVRAGVEVVGLVGSPDGWELRTDDESVRTKAVVVATGAENRPRVPTVAGALPQDVVQLHAADYRRPDALPDGPVLVVGSAQTGCQVAEDLLDGGREVVLATSRVGRLPATHRGLGVLRLLASVGFFDQRPEDLPDPAMMTAPQPVIAPGGRDLGLADLVRRGAALTGRVVATDGVRVLFDDSLAANVAAGDAFAARVRTMVDGALTTQGRALPEAGPDDDGAAAVPAPGPAALDLRALGAVVWCTGFAPSCAWLGPELLEPSGAPRREGTAGAAPGLWILGLRWLTHRTSSNFHGMPRDAEEVAEAVIQHLAATARRTW